MLDAKAYTIKEDVACQSLHPNKGCGLSIWMSNPAPGKRDVGCEALNKPEMVGAKPTLQGDVGCQTLKL